MFHEQVVVDHHNHWGVSGKGPRDGNVTIAASRDRPADIIYYPNRLFGPKALAKLPPMWSSTYRGRPAYVSDSDSDVDPDVDAAEYNDARLIREMDLSGRHETVEYRPNPWSIARINAASRPCPKPALVSTPRPAMLPPKPQPKPIVEAFKKQAQRLGVAQPVVHDIRQLGVDSIAVDATKCRASPTKKAHQGCQRTHNTALVTPPPHIERCKLQAESIPLAKPTSAHIATPFNHVAQSAHAPLPFKIRRGLGTHRVAQSSPVRQAAPIAVGDRPSLHHSSPGPGPASGKVLSNLAPRKCIEVLVPHAPSVTTCIYAPVRGQQARKD